MTHIFIEAKDKNTSEYQFIRTYLSHIGKCENVDYMIECVNGKDNLNNILPRMNVLNEEGHKVVVVFDADSSQNAGGYLVRRPEIEKTLDTLEFSVPLFLFPNNNEDGMFEDLLLSCTQADVHSRFFGCYNDYEFCLGNDYVHPNIKGKVYAYISAQKTLTNNQRKKLGRGDWQFSNSDYWNLDSDSLAPLKEFLENNIE